MLEKAVKLPKFAAYQLLPASDVQPSSTAKVTCTIKDRCQRIKMWIEQCFIVGDLNKWIKEDSVLTVKFVSVVDGKDLVISFSEKDSQVLFALCS